MSTGNWTEADVLRINALRSAKRPIGVHPSSPLAVGAGQTGATLTVNAKPSKYHNVKVFVGTEKFDSKHEAEIWLALQVRERIGEISDLTRQFVLDLCCPSPDHPEESIVVARYIADFRYLDVKTDTWRYIDAKSKATRTQIYRLKAKWVFLQLRIEIEEV